jgi:hypothetical protein
MSEKKKSRSAGVRSQAIETSVMLSDVGRHPDAIAMQPLNRNNPQKLGDMDIFNGANAFRSARLPVSPGGHHDREDR